MKQKDLANVRIPRNFHHEMMVSNSLPSATKLFRGLLIRNASNPSLPSLQELALPSTVNQTMKERAGTRGAWNFSLQSGLLEQWFYLLAHITRDEPSTRRDRRWSGRKAVAVASSSRLARLALKTSDFGRGGKSEGAGYTVEKSTLYQQ